MSSRTPSKLAGGLIEPIPGPNEHTVDELKALKAFADSASPGLPHLVAWQKYSQGSDGPLPGGYISCMLMTIVPGENLLDLGFWSMTFEQQQEIRDTFLVVLKYALSSLVTRRPLVIAISLTELADKCGNLGLDLTIALCEISCGKLKPENCVMNAIGNHRISLTAYQFPCGLRALASNYR